MSKPNEFFIGIHDFFAVLLPGAAAAYFAVEEAQARGASTMLEGHWAAVAFLFASYVLGHLLFMIAAYLDGPYVAWRKLWKTGFKRTDDGTFSAARTLYHWTSSLRDPGFSVFKWCRCYVSLRAPGVRSELDRFEATSKFFRTFVVVLLLGAVAIWFSEIAALQAHQWVLCVLGLGLAVLCFLLYCDQRWKLNELAFAYAVMIDELPQKPATASGGDP